ncbi:MAG: uracil-DNA glycosylase [Gammaproteobacteria bacterium]|nr:uracil-DNA glycosylase [Gammaproteobacteria bacterium]TVQ45221.1 MAG: uracil-DNA glycosylase [Gammaproteobacteria bacterium]
MTDAAVSAAFDPQCRRCPRLADHLDAVRASHPDYHAAPVPAFGVQSPRLLIVGLAPGMHGANRTGRPFTGDHAGILLYATLHGLGLADRSESVHARDGLRLRGCRITNAVKCLPPENRPTGKEVANCTGYLAAELATLPQAAVILALGGVAHRAIVRALGLRQADYDFGHGAEHLLPEGQRLVDSYHCSRYNTQTGRLTGEAFETVVRRAAGLAGLLDSR